MMAFWLVLAVAMLDPFAHAGDISDLLKPCPSSPNCVSSLAQDQRHRIDPFAMVGTAEQSLERLARTLAGLPRTRIIQKSPLHLRVECRTRLGFVDDLDFWVDEARQVVQVRSASRIGYWDFGVNRRRVETLRHHYMAATTP